jgi:hypothetical protein
MRSALCICLLIGSCFGLAGQQPSPDPYSLVAVRGLMDRVSQGVTLGIDVKVVTRLGDRCAVAILKIVDQQDLKDPRKATVIVTMIHNSFAYPQNITVDEDKDPRVSLFLLAYLLEKVNDAQLQRQIQQTIEFVKTKTSVDHSTDKKPE